MENAKKSGNDSKIVATPNAHVESNARNRRSPTGLWMVMDGRARFDTDEASVLEALCSGSRDNVPRKAASKMWSDHDAVLVFAPKIGVSKEGNDLLGEFEYVEDVK